MFRKVEMTRIQIEISSEKLKEFEDIMTEAEIPTKRELFNLALTLLKWVVREMKRGRIVASVDERDKTYKELVIPALNTIAEKARVETDRKPFVDSNMPLQPTRIGG